MDNDDVTVEFVSIIKFESEENLYAPQQCNENKALPIEPEIPEVTSQGCNKYLDVYKTFLVDDTSSKPENLDTSFLDAEQSKSPEPETLVSQDTKKDEKLKSLKLLQLITDLTTPCSVLLNSNEVTQYLEAQSTSVETYIEDTTSTVTQHQCDVCFQSYYSLSGLQIHKNRIPLSKKMYCGICNLICYSEICFEVHLIKIHNIYRYLNYEKLGYHSSNCTNNHELKNTHTKKIDHINYLCKLCNKTFASELHILCHVKNNHYINKCYNCGRCFTKFCNLIKHIECCLSFHGKIDASISKKYDLLQETFKINTCPFCLYESNQNDLNLHMKYCKNTPKKNISNNKDTISHNECPLCRKIILEENLYYQHVVECNKAFGTKKYCVLYTIRQLDKHNWISIHNGKEIEQNIPNSQIESHFLNINDSTCKICDVIPNIIKIEEKESQFSILNKKCNICNFCNTLVESSKKKLERHKNLCKFILKNRNDFQCKNCPSLFRTYNELIKHGSYCRPNNYDFAYRITDKDTSELLSLINSEYKCKLCNYLTTNKNLIELHFSLFHYKTIAKKFNCKLCNQNFNSKIEIIDHINVYHLNKSVNECVYLNTVKYENISESEIVTNNETQLSNLMSVNANDVSHKGDICDQTNKNNSLNVVSEIILNKSDSRIDSINAKDYNFSGGTDINNIKKKKENMSKILDIEAKKNYISNSHLSSESCMQDEIIYPHCSNSNNCNEQSYISKSVGYKNLNSVKIKEEIISEEQNFDNTEISNAHTENFNVFSQVFIKSEKIDNESNTLINSNVTNIYGTIQNKPNSVETRTVGHINLSYKLNPVTSVAKIVSYGPVQNDTINASNRSVEDSNSKFYPPEFVSSSPEDKLNFKICKNQPEIVNSFTVKSIEETQSALNKKSKLCKKNKSKKTEPQITDYNIGNKVLNLAVLIQQKIRMINLVSSIKEEKMFIVCKVCKQDIKLEDYFPIHILQHQEKQFYDCHMCCKIDYLSIGDIYEHFWLEHLKISNLYNPNHKFPSCENCKKNYFTEEAYWLHLRFSHDVEVKEFEYSQYY